VTLSGIAVPPLRLAIDAICIALRSKSSSSQPRDPAPSSAAPLEEREDWAQRYVAWFFSVTGGDPEIDGVPVGHRWRIEYFQCVRDPRGFEEDTQREIQAYAANGGK
jgi:hypothetical protein